MLFRRHTGEKGRVQRVNVGVENDGIEVPDDNGQGGQQGFIEMHGGGHVKPALWQPSHGEIVGPQQHLLV